MKTESTEFQASLHVLLLYHNISAYQSHTRNPTILFLQQNRVLVDVGQNVFKVFKGTCQYGISWKHLDIPQNLLRCDGKS